MTEGDKVEAQIRLGVAVNGYGVGELAAAVRAARDVRGRRARRRVRRELRDRAEPSARAVSAASRCATRRGSRPACARSSTTGGFQAFTDTFEDLGGLRAAARHRGPAADGRRLSASAPRATGRPPRSLRVLKVMASGLPGGTSFMEDYTYHLAPDGREGPRRAHARGLPVDRRGDADVRDPSALDRRQGRSGPARLHRRARARRSSSGCSTSAPLPARRQPGRRRRSPTRTLPRLPVARAAVEAAARLRDRRRGLAASPAARTTRCSPTALGIEALTDLAEIAGIELVVIDEETRIPAFENELRWNQAYYHLAGGL